jgi:hypothetical protein
MLGHADRATTAKYYIKVDAGKLPAPRSAPERGENTVGTTPTEIGVDRTVARGAETA